MVEIKLLSRQYIFPAFKQYKQYPNPILHTTSKLVLSMKSVKREKELIIPISTHTKEHQFFVLSHNAMHEITRGATHSCKK